MKRVLLFSLGIVALLTSGCGGSGGGSSSTDSTANLGTPQIEAIVKIERTNLVNQSQYTDEELLDPTVVDPDDLIVPTIYGVQDLDNFQTNETYVLQLVAYNSVTGARVILPASFRTGDTDFTYGNLGNSGLYTASDISTISSVGVWATYNNQTYSSTYQLKEQRLRYIGKVVLETGAVAKGVKVNFYDSNGLSTGTVVSAYDGTFRASLASTTVAFSIDPHSETQGRNNFSFGGTTYIAGDPTARPSLTLASTGTLDTRSTPITLVP